MRWFDVFVSSWAGSLVGLAAPIAAFMAITRRRADGPAPGAKRGPERQRRMAEAGYFASRCKARLAHELSFVAGARRKIAGRSHCRPGPLAVRSPSRRPWARPSPTGRPPDRFVDVDQSRAGLSRRAVAEQEADDILRYELDPQRCPEGVEAEDVQILVEVAQPGRQRDRFDAGGCARCVRTAPPRLRRHRRRGRYRAGASWRERMAAR